jgi:hypothetical protein
MRGRRRARRRTPGGGSAANGRSGKDGSREMEVDEVECRGGLHFDPRRDDALVLGGELPGEAAGGGHPPAAEGRKEEESEIQSEKIPGEVEMGLPLLIHRIFIGIV